MRSKQLIQTIAFFMFLCIGTNPYARATDTLFVKETAIPILIDRSDNELFHLRIKTEQDQTLQSVRIRFADDTPLNQIESVKLYYAGTEAHQRVSADRFTPTEYMTILTPGQTRAANPSYSVLRQEKEVKEATVRLEANQPLFKGVNYFWISIRMKPTASLDSKFKVKVTDAQADGKPLPLVTVNTNEAYHRLGLGLRQAGDDGSAAFRIPGLATTPKGTLLAVYDVRYNNSVDLQEHICIGLSRSTDGGRTWEKMRIPIDMTKHDKSGLPPAQNGVGDPCVLVDEKTGEIYIAALWTHGMGNQRAWFSSQQGMTPDKTGQLVLTKSTDDGRTWSDPINITSQVKHPEWFLLLQGPGRGITMQDGTLVFPIQFIAKDRIPHAGIMYSKDRGKSWNIHEPARSNTTEAQVVEVEPGVLMLNMRDNRGGSRAVCTTNDLGKTWNEHPTSRKDLIEPVCMASLLRIPAAQSPTGKDLIFFSNPNTTKGRTHITLKWSTDKANSWPAANQLLLDEAPGWGYSCLTQIDRNTIGILYESSVAQMTFQRINLNDLLK